MKFLDAIKRIEKPTRILLGGFAVALLVVGIGYTALLVNKLHVADLVAQCESAPTWEETFPKSRTTQKKDKDGWDDEGLEPIGAPSGNVSRENEPLVCEPKLLVQFSSYPPSNSIQAQIKNAYEHGERRLEQALFIASIVALFSGIPYAWYFLLRRIRELHDAIMGK